METSGRFSIIEPEEFHLWLRSQNVTRKIRTVQQHHTYIPDYSHFRGNNHFDLLESMERSHLERGFSDIAQHFTTFPDGNIGTGRNLNKIPAGIKGANTGAICIENLGCFDKARDMITDAQKRTIIQTTATLLNSFGITADTDGIIYHHWFDLSTGERTDGTGTTKSCPGTNFFEGNSVSDCQEHFLPLIRSGIEGLSMDVVTENAIVHGTGHVMADSLYVRRGPSSGFSVIDTLHKGAEVNCYEFKGKWWRIHPIEDRWIYSNYVHRT